ncbi:hypothetical protein J6590_090912 [Homalodisca vitripennis]|nr:hypothetical protein J6590_090912 [Homalodisca vitripennis]
MTHGSLPKISIILKLRATVQSGTPRTPLAPKNPILIIRHLPVRPARKRLVCSRRWLLRKRRISRLPPGSFQTRSMAAIYCRLARKGLNDDEIIEETTTPDSSKTDGNEI